MAIDLEKIFTFHDDKSKIPNYVAVRESAKAFARIVLDNTPACADQTAAIRKIREAVMTANAAIALDGAV